MRATAGGWVLSLMLLCAALPAGAEHIDAVSGRWEGPWYRGMTSGKLRLDVAPDGGTIQFTNLDKFGDASHPITGISFDGTALQFRAEGEAGGVLTAKLNLGDSGQDMKGTGRFDGFPLRFELKRSAP